MEKLGEAIACPAYHRAYSNDAIIDRFNCRIPEVLHQRLQAYIRTYPDEYYNDSSQQKDAYIIRLLKHAEDATIYRLKDQAYDVDTGAKRHDSDPVEVMLDYIRGERHDYKEGGVSFPLVSDLAMGR